ncbi:MAG: hypothetical protein WC479_09640 [Candidatus Izemoplasmatales bacterium]
MTDAIWSNTMAPVIGYGQYGLAKAIGNKAITEPVEQIPQGASNMSRWKQMGQLGKQNMDTSMPKVRVGVSPKLSVNVPTSEVARAATDLTNFVGVPVAGVMSPGAKLVAQGIKKAGTEVAEATGKKVATKAGEVAKSYKLAPEAGALNVGKEGENLVGKVTKPVTEGVPVSKAQSYGVELIEKILRLDAERVQDIKYRSLLGTAAKQPLRKGETWRSRVLSTASSDFRQHAVADLDNVQAQRIKSVLPDFTSDAVSKVTKPVTEDVNTKIWYHGSGTPGMTADKLDPLMSKEGNLFGFGVYLTDNPDIASQYAAKRGGKKGTPSTYATKVNISRVLDMEQPIDPDVADILVKHNESNGDVADIIKEVLKKPGVTTEQVWDAMSDGLSRWSHEERIASYEVGDILAGVSSDLRAAGYDALTHTGGLRAGAGKVKHKVLILLDPNDRLTSPGVGRKGQVTQFNSYNAASSPAGAKVSAATTPLEAAPPIAPSGARVLDSTSPPNLAPKVADAIPPVEPPKVPPVAGATPAPRNIDVFAANIRLSKFDNSIHDTLKVAAQNHSAEIQAARRGVMNDAAVQQKAVELVQSMGGDPSEVAKNWKVGKVYNAEELATLNGALQDNLKEITRIKATVAAGNIAPLEIAKLNIALSERQTLSNHLLLARAGTSAETGRALAYHRALVKDMETNPDAAKLKKLIHSLGGWDKVQAHAEIIEKLDLNDPVVVNNFIRSVNKPKIGDYIMEVYYNSILSGPKTHIINSITNTMNAMVAPVELAVSASVEGVAAKIGRRTAQRSFAEIKPSVVGAMQGVKEGVTAALYTMKNGVPFDQSTKWEFRPHAFKGKLGWAINIPSNALTAADQMMYAVNYRAALNTEASRIAKSMGLKGDAYIKKMADLVSSPSTAIVESASKQAEYRLFRQEPGKLTAGIMGMRDYIDIKGVQPLRFVIPFVKTPVNIAKYGLERSPAGLLNIKMWGKLAKGNPEGADQLGRALIGTAVAGGIAAYFGEGKITAAAPTNVNERDRFYRDGKQPYSIRVGDTWVSYQRLEPFNQPLGMVGAVVDAVNQGDEVAATKKAEEAVISIGKNFLSQTYMSSLSDLMNMLSEPERYAGSFMEKIGTALVTPASSALRSATQMVDPVVREPQNFAERLKSGIPGLSTQVQPKVGTIGGDVERQSELGAAGAVFPISVTPSQETSVTRELDRMKYNFGQMTNKLTLSPTQSIKLSPEEYTTFKRVFSAYAEQNIQRTILSADYIRGATDQREKLLDKAIADARAQTRATMNALLPASVKQQRILEQQVEETRKLGQTNPAAEKKIVFQNPQILAIRKQQALQALTMKGGA